MATPPPKNSSNRWLLPVILVLIATSLFLTFWSVLRPKNGKNPEEVPIDLTKKFSAEESQKLIELRNQSIGNLENHEFAKADEALSEILRLLPSDPFAPRNLAICRQLSLESGNKNRSREEFSLEAIRAKASIEKSKSSEPDSFVPWVIASRVASKLDESDEALNCLREAVRLAPDSVGPAYDLFTFLESMPGEKKGDESFDALRFVYQHEQQNLFVLKDWLPLLAQRRAPEFIETLKQAEETIAPFVEMIKVHTRIDLRQTIEAARAAAAESNWPVAQRSMTILKNLIVSEAARDKRFVIRDSLEYILQDFRETTLSRLEYPASDLPVTRPVHFLPPGDVSTWPRAEICTDIAVADFNLDDRTDLVVLQIDKLVAWCRHPTEDSWTVCTTAETGGAYTHVLMLDVDDDVDQELRESANSAKSNDETNTNSVSNRPCHSADPDAILFGPAGLKILENRRTPKSTERNLVARSGGAAFDEVRDVSVVAVADLDSDGDLDIVASTKNGIRIFSNRGNLTFDDISSRSLLPPVSRHVTAIAIVDWDKDSDIDLLIADDQGGGLLENVRHGQLRYRALDDFSKLRAATSLQIGDFNGDVSWDVVTAGPLGANVVFTNRTPAGLVGIKKTIPLAATPVVATKAGDFDNDGLLDVLVLKDDGASIFRGGDQSILSPVPRNSDDWLKNVTLLLVDDLDRDGDLDLVIAEQGSIICLSSQCRESDNPLNGWLEMQLTGERIRPGEQNWDKRVNHINLGGIIELKAGDRYQERIITGPTTHFGLGNHRRADVARVLWTNGIPSNVMAPSPDESICIEQKLVGSCPYLYAWNGERFEFVTDLLWNAPIGLKFAETVVAPWREWEYLKINGNELKPNNNEYQLRITAELWEAEYFDQIKLFAIDHPVGTEIFTNEKVGPASIAEPTIHTVQSPRKPVAARDSHGRNVLPQVINCDGNYTKTFDKRLAQGLTEEHFLELDLGDFQDAKIIRLYLTGWMYPGSTSLSVQFSQNPDLPKPRPPALYAPDANGEWSEVLPYMGFPGGKTKTIAVDVSNVFSKNDHRLRIVSTMELYWDSVFFTVDDSPVEIRQTELTLVSANLVDRGGVSFRSWPLSGNGPDRFDYSNLVIGEQWPAMSGNFTRFGDVLPLLTARDDQLVVTGSGDEIRLAFAVPGQSVEPGLVRDFVIYTVGWDKDADPNTVYGTTVEPLPFEAMTVYAHRDGVSREPDSAYQEYLRNYQTRQRNPTKFWKSIKQWQQTPR